MLALAGGIAGLGLAMWSIDALVALSPGNLPRLNEVALDWRVLLFTLGVCVVTGILFGTAPAIHASRLNLNNSLKDSSRGSTEGVRSKRSRQIIVIAEVALAVVLLVRRRPDTQKLPKASECRSGIPAGERAYGSDSGAAFKVSRGSSNRRTIRSPAGKSAIASRRTIRKSCEHAAAQWQQQLPLDRL